MIRFLLALILVSAIGLNTLEAQNFRTHKVKQGETIEDIAKRYNIKSTDLYRLNPDIQKELKADAVLIIPNPKTDISDVSYTKEIQGFKDHKVKAKETIFSISKEYGISEDELKKYNKYLYANPLKKGDDIQIPVFKTIEVVKTQQNKSNTKIYKVLPAEGKWRIAQKFGITLEELEKLNPSMGEVIQEGQELNVPNVNASEEKNEDGFISYTVLPQEGFYSLKNKLGIDQEALERLNPGLKESGLKTGMVLKIPSSNKGFDKFNKAISSTNLVGKLSTSSTKRIAFMLPFGLDRVHYDSIAATKLSIKSDPYLNASLDFYSGVLMALDSLNTLGVKLEVTVYDTKREISETTKILSQNNFQGFDAVIGPLVSDAFEKVASELNQYKVPVVSPTGTNLKFHENVFQTKPSTELLKSTVIDFVKKKYLSNNIIVISDSKHANVANKIKTEFSNAKLISSRKTKDGKDANYLLVDDISYKLNPGTNIVFLETQNDGFASNVTSVLASLIKKEDLEAKQAAVDIILVTTNFNSAFESDEISNEHLSKLQLHFASSSRVIDENNSFVKKYKSVYYLSPEASAVKGFDLTMDVALRLASFGDLYASVTKAPLTEHVENKFSYIKKTSGGYSNQAVYLVKYEDLVVVEVE